MIKRTLQYPADKRRCCKKKAGFSLIEILVAIVILAVLGVFVVGAMQKSVVSANAIVSANQLKAIWGALNLYRGDNNNYFPAIQSPWPMPNGPLTAWTRQPISPYLPMRTVSVANEAFICPNAQYTYEGYRLEQLTRTYAATAAMVGFNNDMSRANNQERARHGHSVERPEWTILLFDAGQSLNKSAWSEAASLWPWVEAQIGGADVNYKRIDYRQNGKAHFMFADGHLEAMTPEEAKQRIKRAVWDGMWFLDN